MSFPLSPANNQTALVNGIVYQWNNVLGVWKRNGSINSASIGQLLLSSAQQSTTNGSGTLIVSGGAGITGNVYTGGIFITGSANGITFSDGSVQTSAGASAATGAAAFAQANAANVLAQAAFNTANTKFSSSGGTITGDTVVTGNLTITGATVYANTENLIVKDNIITLNSNVTGAPTLSAGIEVNRGSSTNTKLLWSEANTAWEFTNDGTTYEKIAGLTYVQAAFNAANTAGGADTFARQTANAAFTQANTATTLAQAAFNKANTSDAVLTSTVDTFTGDGSTVAYTLSTTPATINYTTAVIGGVTQPRSAYSVVGTTLTFTSAPANTQIIEVTTIGTSNTTLYTVNNIISPFLLMGA